MTDNPVPVESIAGVKTVTRFPLERRVEQSVEFMQMLSLEREDVAEAMKEAGHPPPRSLSMLKKNGAREVRSHLAQWDPSAFTDEAELELELRAWFQPAVSKAIRETAEARDMISQERQILLATSIEHRLMNVEYRQQRAAAARRIARTWELSGQIMGGWEVVVDYIERFRAGKLVRKTKLRKATRAEAIQPDPVAQDGNVVSLGAWRAQKGT